MISIVEHDLKKKTKRNNNNFFIFDGVFLIFWCFKFKKKRNAICLKY